MDLLGDDALLNVGTRTARIKTAAKPTPDMNSDLASWQMEEDDPTCHICSRNGTHRCADCHHMACAGHTWVMFGLCKQCATEEQVARWNKEREIESKNWLEDL